MALFSVIVTEGIHARAGRLLLIPLVLLGIGSVLYWYAGEKSGSGDLRLYFLVQGLPLLTIPLILWLYPGPFSHSSYLWLAVAAYGIDKLFEIFDHQVFESGFGISGHTLKHLFAAAGCYLIYPMHKTRRCLPEIPVNASRLG
jgi:hypothetical protein